MATNDEYQKLDINISVDDLRATHVTYDIYYDEWEFLESAYEGISALIAYGALYKHERESTGNYQRRINSAYGFGYTTSIVELFNSYLFKKDYPQSLPDGLANDELWSDFLNDADLEDNSLDDVFIDASLKASIMGHVGLLVDRPKKEVETVAQEKKEGIYPYVVIYKPTAILDWEYERDEYGRRRLVYLKLKDDDGYYRIWTPYEFQIWEIVKDGHSSANSGLPKITTDSEGNSQKVGTTASPGEQASLVDSGEHDLEEIPFVYLYATRSQKNKNVGKSDVSDVARIDASIMRNLSQIEEIIDYASFPMMRKPMPEKGTSAAIDQDDEVGITAVLEFDPENPDSKPDWLKAEVQGPVMAILSVIAKKVEEIYRASNAGGMASMEVSKQAKSGASLKAEFQLLNSKLVKKGKNMVKAKRKVVEFWLRWQGEYDKYKDDLKFDYIKSYEVEDLATDLENLLTGKIVVDLSPLFNKEVQKMAVRKVLPSDNPEVLSDIEKEIDAAEIPVFTEPDIPDEDEDLEEEEV